MLQLVEKKFCASSFSFQPPAKKSETVVAEFFFQFSFLHYDISCNIIQKHKCCNTAAEQINQHNRYCLATDTHSVPALSSPAFSTPPAGQGTVQYSRDKRISVQYGLSQRLHCSTHSAPWFLYRLLLQLMIMTVILSCKWRHGYRMGSNPPPRNKNSGLSKNCSKVFFCRNIFIQKSKKNWG